MTRKEIIEILASRNLSASKKLGQNFIWQPELISRIVAAGEVTAQDTVLEIGPGLGALTEELLATGARVIAVEFDRGLHAFLTEKFAGTALTLIHGDFLKTQINEPVNRVVSNLPYYCSSEMLFRIAETIAPETITVMLQTEMAARITAQAGTDDYGALTLGLGIRYTAEPVLTVPPDSFFPEPGVRSSVIRLCRRAESFPADWYALYTAVVRGAFWGRRKTILKSLAEAPNLAFERPVLAAALERAGIEPARRGETLNTDEFAKLTDILRTTAKE